MAHFNRRQGLFQSKGELAKYINDGEKEYIPYDYSYSEDIFPAINNLFPDAKKIEINRTDIFGYNAIMSVILNENMTDDLKLDVIQMLIDKGCDVNWLNYQRETALLIALERIEIDIANLLLDNGAVIYKE